MRIIAVVVSIAFGLVANEAWAAYPLLQSIEKPAQSVSVQGEQMACKGCGCRGGAGYRLANGKCAGRRG